MLLIDDRLLTSAIAVPLREGWVEPEVETSVRRDLRADQVGPRDVALIALPEATLLPETHVIDPRLAIVTESVGPIGMRTAIRPDGVESSPIWMKNVGPTADVLTRALLRPFFGITADLFINDADAPEVDDAQVVIVDDLIGVSLPDHGFQEDLARAWFVLTGMATVHAVTVVGVEALARGYDAELAALQSALASGRERRRDVRQMISAEHEIDRDRLVEITNAVRFELTAEDRRSARDLIARGTWGTAWKRTLPAFVDELPSSTDG